MRGHNVITRHRIRPDPELLGLRQADTGSQQAGGEGRQDRDRDRRHHGRTPGHPFGNPVPGSGIERGAAAGAGDEGPKQAPAAQREHRRQHHQDRHRGDHKSARRQGAQAAGARGRGEQEGQQGQHHGGVAGDDGRPRHAHRPAQRITVRGVPRKFLTVARNQQQRVIGACPENQDAGDSGRGAVEAQPGQRRHRGAHRRRDPVGEPDHQQRRQPQHRRAVGGDQQQRHHRRRHRQQGDVGVGERVGDVRAERRPPGDVGPQSRGQAGVGGGAQGGDRAVEFQARQVGAHGNHADGRFAVARDHHRCRAGVLGERQHPVEGRPGGADVRGAEHRAIGAADHDDQRNAVAAGELAGQGVDLGGIRAGGHRQRCPARCCVPADEHHEANTQQDRT